MLRDKEEAGDRAVGVMDKRRFTRIPFEACAELRSGAAVAGGAIENLSLQGMLVRCAAPLAAGERVEIRVLLSGASSELSLDLAGHVVRSTDGSIAVQFDLRGIDIDALTHLRYIVGYALGDADTVMDEYYRFMREQDPEEKTSALADAQVVKSELRPGELVAIVREGRKRD